MSRSSIGRYVLPDTGFWLGLCDAEDDKAGESARIFQSLERFKLVVPWPIHYEVLRTRGVRQPTLVEKFERALRRAEIIRLDDSPYRDRALEATFDAAKRRRAISLVDMVLRLMIEDPKLRIDAVVTYNPRDFVDVCRRRQIRMICESSLWP